MMSLYDRVLPSNFLHLPNTIVLLMAGAFLSSCANMSEGNRMRRDDALIGAGIGAVGGAVVCKDGNKAACGAAGAAIGGTLGYVIGDQGAKRIDRMDHRSAYDEHLTCDIQQEIAEIANYNYELRRQVDQYERDIKNNIDRRRSVQEALRTAQEQYKKLLPVLARARQKAASSPNQREQLWLLEQHIHDLDLSIRRLNEHIRSLKNIRGSHRVGGGW